MKGEQVVIKEVMFKEKNKKKQRKLLESYRCCDLYPTPRSACEFETTFPFPSEGGIESGAKNRNILAVFLRKLDRLLSYPV